MQRVAEEKAKKKAALKRQEELEQKRKMEEEARKKKIQQVICFLWSIGTTALVQRVKGTIFSYTACMFVCFFKSGGRKATARVAGQEEG